MNNTETNQNIVLLKEDFSNIDAVLQAQVNQSWDLIREGFTNMEALVQEVLSSDQVTLDEVEQAIQGLKVTVKGCALLLKVIKNSQSS